MASRIFTWLARPLALRTLASQARLAARLWREPRVPALIKTVPLIGALYILSPVDFVPDFLPVLGQLDDIGVAILAIELFLRLCPSSALAFHREALAQRRPYSPMSSSPDPIEAEWRHG